MFLVHPAHPAFEGYVFSAPSPSNIWASFGLALGSSCPANHTGPPLNKQQVFLIITVGQTEVIKSQAVSFMFARILNVNFSCKTYIQ